ncbi:MAG: hypothetical protein ACLU3I_11865 [Acutalibacteraceae bacterium]
MAGSCDDRHTKNNDTCVSHTSQNGTPRLHQHGGRVTAYGAALPAAVCLTYEKNNIYSGGSSMDKQLEESKPKSREEILSLCRCRNLCKGMQSKMIYILQEALKRSVFSYGFYNNSYKT